MTPTQLHRAEEAFNGFAQLFGKAWIESLFQGALSHMIVLNIMSLWEDWSAVEVLNGSNKLLQRWRAGVHEGGVEAEVRVVAHLLRQEATVELFPSTGNRIPDCRFSIDDDWVYVEVSQRGLSKVRQRGTEIVNRVATAAGKAVAGMHGKVAILRDPRGDELENLISWLETISYAGEARLGDLAVFYTDRFDSGTGDNDKIAQLVPKPRLFCTYVATGAKGTACLRISDEAAQEVLKAEASQLPRDHPGMIFLDVSRIIGGYEEWCPLIHRRLQPKINTRISAVVVFRILLAHDGPKTEGDVLLNPHARNPMPQSAIRVAQMMVEANSGEPER